MLLLLLGLVVLVILIVAGILYWKSRSPTPAPAPPAPAPTPAAVADTASRIGIRYKSTDATVIRLATNLQALIDQVQTNTCTSMLASSLKLKDSMISNMKQASSAPLPSCDQMKTSLSSQRAYLKLQLINYPGDKDKLIDSMIALASTAIDAVCVNNKVDVDKLSALLTNILNAFCMGDIAP